MGVPWKFGEIGLRRRTELRKFTYALQRCKDGRCTKGFHFSNDIEGFSSFLKEVGEIPEEMVNPSLGRKDHDKGYEPGNIFWQELSENCAENGRRQGRKNGVHLKGRTLSETHRNRISEGMKRFKAKSK